VGDGIIVGDSVDGGVGGNVVGDVGDSVAGGVEGDVDGNTRGGVGLGTDGAVVTGGVDGGVVGNDVSVWPDVSQQLRSVPPWGGGQHLLPGIKLSTPPAKAAQRG
jgi:hypothetical protein